MKPLHLGEALDYASHKMTASIVELLLQGTTVIFNMQYRDTGSSRKDIVPLMHGIRPFRVLCRHYQLFPMIHNA